MIQNIVSYLPWNVRFTAQWIPVLSADSVMTFRRFTLKNEAGLSKEGETVTLKLRSPMKCNVTLREAGSDVLTFDEVIGQQVYKPVVDLVKDCEYIIDLGGNIGLASLYFSGHYPNSKITVLEPNESSFRVISQNLAGLVERGRCKILKAAVWSTETELSGAEMDEPGHYSAFRIQELSDQEPSTDSIAGMTMSGVIKTSGFPRVDLLKIDIEGAEVEVFKGDLSWLDQVGAIAIEFHDNSREESRFDEIMKARGFRLIDEGGHTVIALKSKS